MELKILHTLESRLNQLKINSNDKQEIERLENNIIRLKTHIAKIEHLNQEIFKNLENLKTLKDNTRLYKILLKNSNK
jgi:hypothetical protein